jgi:quinol monooxygenase YgiN
MSKYGYFGQLKAKPGKADELIQILLTAAKDPQSMKGCHHYIVGKDVADENTIWISELWESKEAHGESLKHEETRALIAKAMPLIDGMPQKGIEMNVVGGLGS